MALDIGTLSIFGSITNLMQVLALFVQWRLDKTHRGPGWWALGITANCLGFMFAFLRGLPHLTLLGVVGDTILFMLCQVFLYIGTLHFFGQRVRRKRLIAFLAVYILVDIYYIFFNDDIVIRRTILNLTCAAFLFLSARVVLLHKTPSVSVSANFLAGAFGLNCVVLVLGAFVNVFSPPDAGLLVSSIYQVSAILEALIGTMLETFGFILLVNQRLGAESYEARKNRDLIFNTSPDAIMVSRLADGYFVDFNDGFTALTGYTRAELVGKSALEINIWKFPSERDKIVAVLSEKGFCDNQEMVFQRKDGSDLVGIVSAKALTLEGLPHILSVTRDITERKRAEEAIRESESKYHSLFENMQEGFSLNEIITDVNGRVVDFRILEANEAYERHSGIELAGSIGKTMLEILPQADPRQIELYGQVALTGKPVSFEYHSKLINRHFRVRAFCPGPGRFANIFEDITERMVTEQALVESEARFREVLENSLDAAYKRNLKTNSYDYMSPVFARLTGYTPEEMASLPIETVVALINHDDRTEIDRVIGESNAGPQGATYEVEYRFKRRDGQYRWLIDRFTFFRDAAGQPMARIGSVGDITERKQAEYALRASEREFHTLAESMPQIVWVCLPDGKNIYFNQQWVDYTGMTLEESYGDGWSKPFHPDDQQRAWNAWQNATNHGGEYSLEARLRCVDGSYSWWLVRGAPYKALDGTTLKWFGTFTDINQLKQAEEALRAAHDELEMRVLERTADLLAANAALERASKAKDDFMAIVSHELRTPLTGILGLSQVLQFNTYGEMNPKQTTAVQNIEKSGQHLLELVNQILDFSRLQSGKVELEKSLCSLDSICRASLRMVEPISNKKNQELSFRISPDNILLQADERRLRQVLINLLSNAVKFTPGGGRIALKVAGLAEDGQVRISVSDTGIGIKEEDLPRLFQPFVQLDMRLSRQYEGTGLGLALVSQLVELHGGKVEVESAFGEGSCFTVILPWQAFSPQDENTSADFPDHPGQF